MSLTLPEKQFLMQHLYAEYFNEIVASIQKKQKNDEPYNDIKDLLPKSPSLRLLYVELSGLENIKECAKKKAEIQDLIRRYVFAIIKGIKNGHSIEGLKLDFSMDVKAYSLMKKINPSFFNEAPKTRASMTLEELKVYEHKMIASCKKCQNPLFAAIINDKPYAKIQSLMLRDPYLKFAEDADGNNVIHLATVCNRPDLIQLFSEAGVNINAQNKYELAPMHLASICRHGKNSLEKLFELKADSTIETHCIKIGSFLPKKPY